MSVRLYKRFDLFVRDFRKVAKVLKIRHFVDFGHGQIERFSLQTKLKSQNNFGFDQMAASLIFPKKELFDRKTFPTHPIQLFVKVLKTYSKSLKY